jgi:hypothetical protein
MWQLDNRTPFAADKTWVRDRTGAEVWLVAVKCTFDIERDGTTQLSAEQPPVLQVPEYMGEPGRSSLKYEADLVLTKVTTDVVVRGHAYAPDGKPVTQLHVSFRVGPIHKTLRVVGDRVWGELRPSSPQPFVKMPIIYERAFGGVDRLSAHPERDWDPRNPVGTGFAVHRDHLTKTALPNIEYPNELIRSGTDRPTPAGFGPIASHWKPRSDLAGTYDERWLAERDPLWPTDLDDRFFQSTPSDQQAPDFLRGGETVVLDGLSPVGVLRCTLPEVTLRLQTRFQSAERQPHEPPRLHTVILEPDYPRLSLVFHSAFPCHFKVLELDRTVVAVKHMTLARPAFQIDTTRQEFV